MSTDYFNRLHETWNHEATLDMSPFYHTRKRLVEELAGSSKTSSPRLDVGCGIGSMMPSVAGDETEIDGVDVALNPLLSAKTKMTDARFVLSDARQLPFPDNHYQLVVCSEVLEHIEDDEQAVKEITRVLAPQGAAIFTVPHGNQHWTNEDRADGHLRRYTKKGFEDLMKRAGLEIDELKCWGFPFAVIFRKTVSTPLINRGFQKSGTRAGRSLIFRSVLKLLVTVFKVDDLFHSTQLGIGIAARVHKPPNPKTNQGTLGDRP